MKTLAQIQKELKAPKSQYNSFGKYAYRNCEDIVEALKPLLSEKDLFTLSDEIVQVGDRYYVKATATFNDVSVSAFAREALEQKGMNESQLTGSTSSYARKYALLNAYKIATGEDPDADASKGETTEKKPSEKRVSVTNYLVQDVKIMNSTLQHFNLGRIDDASDKQIEIMYSNLKQKGKL